MGKVNGKLKKLKKGRMYTSPVIQSRVRLKYAQGYTKCAICRQERISFPTVQKILTNEAAAELVEQANRDFKALSDISVQVLLYHLVKNKDLNLAETILRSLGIMTKAEDLAVAANAGQPFLPSHFTQISKTVSLSPMSMALIKQLEQNDETFTPGDKRWPIGRA